MRRISTLIWLLYLLSRQLPVFADEQNFLSHTTISRDDQITDLCGLSFITDHHDEIIQNTLRLNPHLNEELAKITEVQYNVGDTASFFTINYKTSTSEKVKARCCYKTDRTYIFVGLSEWNSEQVTQTAVDTFYQAFELKTPAGSLDTNKGIRGILESTFGLPPNKSGDGYVTILIYDIQDDYNPAAGNYTYIAGYFNPTDQTNDITSNRKDIIFVDCNPADPNGTDVLSTVAHEFQHLIHHGVDAGEYLNNGAWVDEGLSEYSEVLCGFKLRSPSRYLLHPERSLITFGTYLGDAITDYAKAALWTYYLGEKFGLPLIQAIARDPKHSVDGVQSALTKQGITLSFDDIFANFVVANYANNINLATDGRYGYQSIEMPILPQIAATHNIYPVAKQQKSLPAYAASYLRYTASDSTAILSFGGQSYGTIRAQIYQIGSETKVTQIPLSTTNQGDYNLQAIGKTADEILLVPTSLGTTFIYYYSVSSEIEDVCPPQITSGPNESLSTEKSITIFWQTDELSTTTVEYGTTSEYGSKAENADYVVAHQVTLANLTPNTLYHYRVGSSDAQGNGPTYSADFTFATITIDQRTLTTVQQAHAFGYEARSLVRDLTGILHLVYHEVVGDRRFVYYTQSADTGATWSAAVPIDTTLYHGGMPSMAIDTHHGLHVVWHAKALASSNYAIYYSHSNDNGTTWTPPLLISKTLTGQDQLYAAVAIDVHDNPHVVWNSVRYTDANIGDVYHKYSPDGGITWQTDQIISSSSVHRCFVPTIDFTSTGKAYVLFSDGLSATGDIPNNIFAVYSDDYQQWSTQEQISTSGALYDSMVSFAIDRSDRIHLVFSDNYTPGVIRIMYTRYESGLWSAPVPVAQPQSQGIVSYPNISIDEQNNLYLVYRDDLGSSGLGKVRQKFPDAEQTGSLSKTQQNEKGDIFLTVCQQDVLQPAINLSADNSDSDYPELPKQVNSKGVDLIWMNQLATTTNQIKFLHFNTQSAAMLIPPKISSFSPAADASDIPYFKQIFAISIIFDQRVVVDSLIPTNVQITSQASGIISGELSYESSLRQLRFVSAQNLLPNDLISVRLTTHITNEAGIGLDGNGNGVSEGSPTDDFVWTFVTQSADTIAPSFTIGVLQNPVLTHYMDIYLIASEYLSELPKLTIGSSIITMAVVNSTAHIYTATYRLSDSGVIQILANGKDLANNSGSASKNFSAQLMIAGQDGMISSPDEKLRLFLPAGAINEDSYLTVVSTSAANDVTQSKMIPETTNDKIYQIGPSSLQLQQPAHLQFYQPRQDETIQTTFYLEQQNLDQTWKAVPTTTAGNWLTADIQSLGNFRLVNATAVLPHDFVLRQNYPNPFSLSKGQTTFFYELPIKANIEIVIFNLLGEQIRRLAIGTQEAGIYPLQWNGFDDRQCPVASGIYFYQLHAANKVMTKKMIVLQ